MKVKVVKKQSMKILDFDIENRPLSYWYDGNCTAEVTAIAASWIGSDDVKVWLLGQDSAEDMLNNFVELFNEADQVTGHYIRRHDLPIINGNLLEYGMPSLSSKLSSDTKLDLMKISSMSLSQESISSYYDLPEPKHHMTQTAWRTANRLSPEGIAQTKKRVVDDVIQHKAMRDILLEKEYLGSPKMWYPKD